ncbi:MAG: hypothetical protein EOO73_30840 [Myxococcales bacterium]|nr:MAG: hypothetical protein EOO73_30840 [Myxococcales bacterium]
MSQSTPLASAQALPAPTWNDEILRELLALQYVRAVAFTNGNGRALHVHRRRSTPAGLVKIADVALAALAQAGKSLQLGRLEVSASVYQEGVLVLTSAGAVRVAVLADAGANLGTLLNQVRRLLRKEETP